MLNKMQIYHTSTKLKIMPTVCKFKHLSTYLCITAVKGFNVLSDCVCDLGYICTFIKKKIDRIEQKNLTTMKNKEKFADLNVDLQTVCAT